MTEETHESGADGGTLARVSLFRYRFGSAEFDEGRFELRVGGLLVDVQQKPLQVLALLLSEPGEVVSKERLFDLVWNQRATGDAVLANAVSKLRGALGDENARSIVTVARQGYRFDGTVERMAVGRRLAGSLAMAVGDPVPGRESYQLHRLLGRSLLSETWLARQPRSGDRRVFKFAPDGERLADLKREVTLYRVLRESLGERDDITRVIDWNFEVAPYWLECAYGGINLEAWAAEPAGDITRLGAATRAERLAILSSAANAVAAAHGVGVLHKDLKPANILIDEDGGGGWRVRLTDFGSGRLIDPGRLAELRITQLGMTLPSAGSGSGTPYYMAPELGRGEAPGARSDVFALGVILYQLLTGDLKRQMAPGWERDVDDELLREDIAYSTDVDPQRRMSSATELANRLRALPQRRVEREAARARAESAGRAEAERLRALARRPWVAAAVVSLAVGTAASLWLYLGQRRANDALAQQFAVSDALNRVLREDLVGAANPARSGRADVTVAEALKSAAERIDERFGAEAPAVRGSLHAAMQTALGELSRSTDAVDAGRRALSALQEAKSSDGTGLQGVRLRLALDLTQLSKLDEARALVREIEADAGLLAAQPAAFRVRLSYVKSWLTAGGASLQESTGHLEQAQALARSTGVETSLRGVVEFALADNYALLGRLAEAEALQRRLADERAREFGQDDPRPLYMLVGLGRTLGMQGKFAEARALLQRATEGLEAKLGAGHRQTLTALDQLAEIRFRAQDYPGAAQDWWRVHQGFVALLGAQSSYSVSVQTNLARALHLGGDPGRAEPLLREALAHLRRFATDDSPQGQQIRYALADCLLGLRLLGEVPELLAGLDPVVLNTAQQEPDWEARLQSQRGRLARLGSEPTTVPPPPRASGPFRGNPVLGRGQAESVPGGR